jgi:pimeloyl-ACP methyl ester carboxylesterase
MRSAPLPQWLAFCPWSAARVSAARTCDPCRLGKTCSATWSSVSIRPRCRLVARRRGRLRRARRGCRPPACLDGDRRLGPEGSVTSIRPEPSSEHLRRWGRQILLRAEAGAAARLVECHAEANVAPDLSAIRVRTLLIHGELDAIIALGVAETAARAISDSKMVVIPGAGHVPTKTRPEEVVAAIQRLASVDVGREE